MKKFLSIAAICLAVFSCKKPIVVPEPEPVPDPVYFTSFGFKAADNACLINDIEATLQSGKTNVEIILPFGILKDDLKTLVATYTVTNPSAVVKHGETVVESGKTVLDFSAPVDILLSTEEAYSHYSINVAIEGSKPFIQIAKSSFYTSDNIVAVINQVDNKLYFAAHKMAESHMDSTTEKEVLDEDKDKPFVLRLNGNTISEYCKTPLIDATADMLTLDFDNEGVAYCSFIDNTSEAAKKVSVGKVTESGFTYLGVPGAIDKPLTGAASDILPITSNNIWSITSNNAAGAVGKRNLNLARFDGSAWTQAAANFGTRVNEYTYGIVAKNIRGQRYILVIDYTSVNISIAKYDEAKDIWVDAPGAIFPAEEKPITTAEYTYGCVDFDVASNGDIFILANADIFQQTVKQYGVLKYSVEDKSLSVIGGESPAPDYTHGAEGTGCRYVSLALDAYDIPYVVFGNSFRRIKDEAGNEIYDPIMCTHLDPETQQWDVLQAVGAPVKTNGVSILFDEEGRGYIACAEATGKVLGNKADGTEVKANGGNIVVFSNQE